MTTAMKIDVRLLSCTEADRIYRMREGTARAAYLAGRIPGRPRGRVVYISAKIADELWGAR